MLGLIGPAAVRIRQAAGGGITAALTAALGLISWLAVVAVGVAGLVASLPFWAVIGVVSGVLALVAGELTVRARRTRRP